MYGGDMTLLLETRPELFSEDSSEEKEKESAKRKRTQEILDYHHRTFKRKSTGAQEDAEVERQLVKYIEEVPDIYLEVAAQFEEERRKEREQAKEKPKESAKKRREKEILDYHRMKLESEDRTDDQEESRRELIEAIEERPDIYLEMLRQTKPGLTAKLLSEMGELAYVSVPEIYDTVEEVQNKIDAFLLDSLSTKTAFGKMIGCSVPSITTFLKQEQYTGTTLMNYKNKQVGATSKVYLKAYHFFEKIRLVVKQPKDDDRVRNEEYLGRWGVKGFPMKNDMGKGRLF